jgi:hypothetical protein
MEGPLCKVNSLPPFNPGGNWLKTIGSPQRPAPRWLYSAVASPRVCWEGSPVAHVNRTEGWTIFDVFVLTALVVGTLFGAKYGAAKLGVAGWAIAAVIGGGVGLILGRLAYAIALVCAQALFGEKDHHPLASATSQRQGVLHHACFSQSHGER